MVVVGELGQPHQIRCQQGFADGDRILGGHFTQGGPRFFLGLPSVGLLVLDHLSIIPRRWQAAGRQFEDEAGAPSGTPHAIRQPIPTERRQHGRYGDDAGGPH